LSYVCRGSSTLAERYEPSKFLDATLKVLIDGAADGVRACIGLWRRQIEEAKRFVFGEWSCTPSSNVVEVGNLWNLVNLGLQHLEPGQPWSHAPTSTS